VDSAAVYNRRQEKKMQIAFSRTGGIVPLPLSCQLDTDKLPPLEARKLTELVEDSGILTSRGATVKNARDMHYYTIEIAVDGKTHKVTFDHVSVPPEIRPLIDYLLERCRTA
jgi:hypothetical protein